MNKLDTNRRAKLPVGFTWGTRALAGGRSDLYDYVQDVCIEKNELSRRSDDNNHAKHQRQRQHRREHQKEQEAVARAKATHASSRTFVAGKEEIKHLYDVGRSLQNEFNPYLKHDAFYSFQTVRACACLYATRIDK